MSNETRRVDTTGYVQQRDPRLSPTPAPQQRPTARPAPQHMALPQHDEPADYSQEHDIIDDEHEAPPAPPAPRAAAQVKAEPVGPVHIDDTTVRLSRAYTAQGEDVRQIKFRKPSTRDLRVCGYPMRNVVGPDGRITAIEELPDVIAKYVTALSTPQLPPSTVNEMDLDDFSACSGVILGFFLR